MSIFHNKIGSESFNDMWALQQICPHIFHILNTSFAITHNTKADVDAIVGEWKTPRVTRKQIFFKPDDESFVGNAGDVVCVLAKCVPFTEVSRLR